MKPLAYFHPPIENYDILKNSQRKEDLVKIMIQTLEDLGYRETAQQLVQESNIKSESDSLSSFRENVYQGHWNEAARLVQELGLDEESIEKAKFLVYEQNYIELILEKQYNDALNLLRNELTHRCKEPERLHRLASLMMCSTPQDVSQKINKTTDNTQARKALLREIQIECKPANMMSANRINKLIQQAISYQIVQCKYHEKIDDNFSLLEDHKCEMPHVPSKSLKTLRKHVDEIWIVRFSPDGNLLASVAKNNELHVWNFANPYAPQLKYRKENIHEKEVNTLNWSHDCKKFATASSDKKIKIWDAETGNLRITIPAHLDNICSVVWMPNDLNIISGGIDNHIIMWDMRGEQVSKIPSPRILEVMVSSNGRTLYVVCAATPKILVIDLVKKTEICQIKEKDLICSATISKDNKFLLVNTSFTFPELHLWSLENYELVQVYTGHFQQKFRIGCCFGGALEQFIACGGEDATVKIFHRNRSEPLATLSGHSLPVNSVTWHPKNPDVLISAGDDHSLRIWTSEETYNKLRDGNLTEENQSMDIISEENDGTFDEMHGNVFEEDDDDSQE